MDEFDLAISDAKAAMLAKGDEFWPHLMLARAYSSLARNDEAHAAYDYACKLNPEISMTYITSLIGTMHAPYLEIFFDTLHKAGLLTE